MTEQELKIQEINTRIALPLDVKIKMTKLKIKQYYEHFNGDVYVSFSGGKDSTVLLNIARDHLDWHKDFDEYQESKFKK